MAYCSGLPSIEGVRAGSYGCREWRSAGRKEVRLGNGRSERDGRGARDGPAGGDDIDRLQAVVRFARSSSEER